MKDTSPVQIVFRLSQQMRQSVATGLLSTMVLGTAHGQNETSGGVGEKGAPVVLVRDGKPVSALVLPQQAESGLRLASEQFVKTVEKSTGAKIPILAEGAEATLSPETARIYVGPTLQAEKEHLSAADLPEEGYRMKTARNTIYILGEDDLFSEPRTRTQSRPTLWALNSILEKQLGVRWLWPGDLGTFVPKATALEVPPTDTTYQPKLKIRRLWLPFKYAKNGESDAEKRKIEEEAFDWVENHQQGKRGHISFGHAFQSWWDKYHVEHPDYFAETLGGVKQPYPSPIKAKLRLANPAVIEQIAKEYQAAGAPDYYNVCPNDGSGFDVSAETQAWDLPQGQSPKAIWEAKANLTARYVQFWNLLHDRLAQINPKVMLESYAYSCYRAAPPAERPLKNKMALGMVPVTFDYEQWKGWSANGSELYLRPNWWHRGADAPYLPLHETVQYFQFIWANGLNGVDMDSIMGYWSTQGLNYYLVARMMTRPDLSADDVIKEYTSAFGAAEPKIREYVEYWEKMSTEFNLMGETGKYPQLLKEGKIDGSMRSSRQALPILYSDGVIAPANQLLADARKLVQGKDEEALQRVEFLQAGLDELRAFRELMAINARLKENKPGTSVAEFDRQAAVVEAMRKKLNATHAIWGDAVTEDEDRQTLFFKPRNSKAEAAE